MSNNIAIQIENVYKDYRLGVYNAKSFYEEIQRWVAKRRNLDDPLTKIGHDTRIVGKTIHALNGLSTTIYKGETVGIIGVNGSGKSTLLKLISHVTIPTQGYIGVNGRISSMLEVGVGFISEMTGEENIYLNGAILGMSKDEIKSKFDEIVEFSECKDFIQTPLKRYSSGMKVKLAFSIAAHLSNEIMILDEVLAVGDLAFQQKCLRRMGDASEYEGKTVLYVSHNMNTIRTLCNRCLVLDQGKIIFDGETEKAIAIYAQNFATQSCSVDLESRGRDKRMVRKINMKKLDVFDRDLPQYTRGETISLAIEWGALTDIPKAYPFITVKSKDGTPLGTSFSSDYETAKTGDARTTTIMFDTSLLSSDEYNIGLGFSSQYGRRYSFDYVDSCFGFDLRSDNLEDKFAEWNHRINGSIILPDLSLKSKK